MNEKLKVQINTYKRSLENKRLQSFIFSFLLLFILLVLDVYGAYSLYRITSRKFSALADIRKLNSDLEFKISNYNDLKGDLDESRFYLNKLEVAIPKDPDTEAFAVEVVEVAAKSGLKQRRLHRLSKTEDYLDLRATLQGPSSQIYPFIEEIESLDRMTVIKRFDHAMEVDTSFLQVVMKIYYLER